MDQNTAAGTPPLLRAIPTFKSIGVGRSKAYGLMNSGEVPAVKVGKSTFIRRGDWDCFLMTRPAYPSSKVN